MAESTLSYGALSSSRQASDANAEPLLSAYWRALHEDELESDYTAQERLDFVHNSLIEHMRAVAQRKLRREAAELAAQQADQPEWST